MRLVRYDLPGRDPVRNLAIEETLTRSWSGDRLGLLFYRHDPAVILGRNQNPWIEADLAELHRRGTPLVRRGSGGGAVYHDPGNLNYGVIMPRSCYEPTRVLGVVVAALRALGIDARACQRSSIWIGDAKISGTAFMLTGRAALLHGCILIDTRLDDLRRLLDAPPAALTSQAVPSVRSPVTRLCDHDPHLTPEAVCDSLTEQAMREFAGDPAAVHGDPPEPSEEILKRLASWEWLYGRTPAFERRLESPRGSITLSLRQARVEAVTSTDDRFDPARLQAALQGCPGDGEALANAVLADNGLAAAAASDLAALLRREMPPLPAPGATVT
ncbi:MAG: lipoate--protein ligase family protein [Lentisphaerae bacterium]|nr:lipoate--protein ligase family protein [Lentisphaerota bacterium]